MSRFDLRDATAEDDRALLALHNRCFASRWDEAWWRWRFRSRPAEDVAILAAFDPRGEAVGMYAGVRLPIRILGGRHKVLNQCDVSIDPGLREGLGGARVLSRLAQDFFASEVHGSTVLTYGYPMPGLRRVMLKSIGARVLCDVVFLVAEPDEQEPAPSGVTIHVVERFGPELDALWEANAGELGTAIVRDAAYCNWRYADHPVPYRLLEARDEASGALRGIAVVRAGGIRDEVASLSEWLVPLEDRAAEHALVAAARAHARELGRAALVAWFASTGEHFRRFQRDHRFFAQASAYQELVFWRGSAFQRDRLHADWYQTMGDIDFF